MTAVKELPPDVIKAREALARKGWSYRKAAPELGVFWMHLAKVLTGTRTSHSLLRRIHQLPDRNTSR